MKNKIFYIEQQVFFCCAAFIVKTYRIDINSSQFLIAQWWLIHLNETLSEKHIQILIKGNLLSHLSQILVYRQAVMLISCISFSMSLCLLTFSSSYKYVPTFIKAAQSKKTVLVASSGLYCIATRAKISASSWNQTIGILEIWSCRDFTLL